VCKKLIKIPNHLGEMSENRRRDFFDSHCREEAKLSLGYMTVMPHSRLPSN